MKHSNDNLSPKRLVIARLLGLLYYSELPEKEKSLIRRWLAEPADCPVKDEELKHIFMEEVAEERTPEPWVHDSLRGVKAELGLVSHVYAHESAPTRRRIGVPRSSRRWIGIAAAVMVPALVVLGLAVAPERPAPIIQKARMAVAESIVSGPQMLNAVSGGGELRRITLPDGSQVWLNGDSRISYPVDFNDDRIVKLDGEAFFSVARLDNKPFVVEGNGVSVRVLGTKFNFRSRNDGSVSEVTLEQGSVEVLTEESAVVLEPLERLSYHNICRDLVKNNIAGENAAPWKSSGLHFDNTPLHETLRRISNYYGVAIGIDERLSLEQSVRVNFPEDEELGQVLTVLQQLVNVFDYRLEEDEVLITAK